MSIPVKFDFSNYPGHLPSDCTGKDHIFSAAISITIFALLMGTAYLWEHPGVLLFSSSKYPTLVFGCIALMLWITSKPKPKLTPIGFSVGVAAVFLSDWMCRSYNLFQGPSIRGELFIGAFLGWWLILQQNRKIFIWFLFFAIFLLLHNFFSEADGRVLFGDDHATFLYRLRLLKDNFPSIPFYYPLWNRGVDARDFFATGALNVYLFFSPLIHIFNIHFIYNAIIATIIFLILPTSVFASARLTGSNFLQASLAAILSLSTSLTWYEWALRFGTVGFVFSAALVPINAILLIDLLSSPIEFTYRKAIFLTISFTLMLFWSASGLIFLPLAIAALFSARKFFKTRPVLLFMVLTLALNLLWVPLFLKVSQVGNFLFSESEQYPKSPTHAHQYADDTPPPKPFSQPPKQLYKSVKKIASPKEILLSLRKLSGLSNPLIIFLCIPGFIFIKRRLRLWFIALSIWLLICGAVLAPLKPQLELDRMLVVLLLILCIPTAYSIEELFSNSKKALSTALASLVASYVLISPFSISALLRNRTLIQYYFKLPIVDELADAIAKNSGNGRTIFAGFVLQELSSGHFAPLSYLTGKPLVASHFVHKYWWYHDVIPPEYLKRKDNGIEDFFDLNNVSLVVSHDEKWRKYFSARPNLYTMVWSKGIFTLFKRKAKSSYFLSGKGEIIDQQNNKILLRLDSKSAVIKFNYFPFLTSPQCKLSPYQVDKTMVFIRISHCVHKQAIVIKSVSPFKRLFL
ncbi:MAG: hypothetical protein D6808_08025 [Candidatus Dadabacteria bacterium]|nr:MAG: hypothetical protein D6808_08025 [Candidatus Dadabacteria bacterium]